MQSSSPSSSSICVERSGRPILDEDDENIGIGDTDLVCTAETAKLGAYEGGGEGRDDEEYLDTMLIGLGLEEELSV